MLLLMSFVLSNLPLTVLDFFGGASLDIVLADVVTMSSLGLVAAVFSSELSARYMSTFGAVATCCIIGFVGFVLATIAVQLVFLGAVYWIGFSIVELGAMAACIGAFALIGFLARRRTIPGELHQGAKKIRSTIGKPRVKSIQETGTKPRVLKIEDE